MDLVPLLAGTDPELSPSGLAGLSLCPGLRPSGPFSQTLALGLGSPPRGRRGWRAGGSAHQAGLPRPPITRLLRVLSLPFFEIFFRVLFFIIFQDKEKESTQQMGILQEVRILFFLSCP